MLWRTIKLYVQILVSYNDIESSIILCISGILFSFYEVTVLINDHGVNTAGEAYILECSVSGRNESIAYQWMDKEGSPITNGGLISITNSTSASYLQFSPLSQSHRGNYTCNATITETTITETTESISFYVYVNGMLI